MKPTENLKPIKDTGISAFEIEYPENSGDYHLYDVAHNGKYISVGSLSNTGFAVDFWIEKDDTFSVNQQLQELYETIVESLYNDEELSGEIII